MYERTNQYHTQVLHLLLHLLFRRLRQPARSLSYHLCRLLGQIG